MTKKDFFRLIIKIFGLYSVILIVFTILPNTLSFVVNEFNFTGLIEIICTLGVILLFFMFLIYKPDNIINWLKLEKGFDEDRIEFQNFNGQNILKLAVIIIGGIILIRNIPTFLSNTFFAFQSSAGSQLNKDVIRYGSTQNYIQWATSFLNIILGYLMLTNYNYISKILNEKNKEEK